MREEQQVRRVRPAESEQQELDRKRRMALSILFQGHISKTAFRINSHAVAREDHIKFFEKTLGTPRSKLF